jgi:hypothetical protein
VAPGEIAAKLHLVVPQRALIGGDFPPVAGAVPVGPQIVPQLGPVLPDIRDIAVDVPIAPIVPGERRKRRQPDEGENGGNCKFPHDHHP